MAERNGPSQPSCGRCGGQLELGQVFSGRGVFWAPPGRLPRFVNPVSGTHVLIPLAWRKAKGHQGTRCTSCRTVTFDY